MQSYSQRALCSLLSITGAVALVVAADPALARTPDLDAVRTARIAYDDLDLQQPAGRATFERRLSSAVAQVCATDAWGRAGVDRACRVAALDRARRDAGITVAAPRG